MSVDIIIYIFIGIIIFSNITYYRKTNRPIISFIIGGLLGIVSLIIACIILRQYDISLNINYTTLCFSFLMGIPSVILMILMLIL